MTIISTSRLRQDHATGEAQSSRRRSPVADEPSTPARFGLDRTLRRLEGFGRNRQYGSDAQAILHDRRVCAGFAAAGVRAYTRRTEAGGEQLTTVLTHLLCDLMHLSDALGLDFTAMLSAAFAQQAAERRGQWEPAHEPSAVDRATAAPGSGGGRHRAEPPA